MLLERVFAYMEIGKGREQDAEALARDIGNLKISRAKDSLLQ